VLVLLFQQDPHMVTRAETELFQRYLERQRSRSPDTGTEDL
jgi:hypothetical protein